jgi:hypothetical protein
VCVCCGDVRNSNHRMVDDKLKGGIPVCDVCFRYLGSQPELSCPSTSYPSTPISYPSTLISTYPK